MQEQIQKEINNNNLHKIGLRLERLGKYYTERYGPYEDEIDNIPEDFKLEDTIDIMDASLCHLEQMQVLISDEIRSNKPETMLPIKCGRKAKNTSWEWPGLVGCSYVAARDAIKSYKKGVFRVDRICPDDRIVEFYCSTRVCVIVNDKDIVIETPRNG